MDFVRTVINSNLLNRIINLPDNLKDKMVEVLILPIEEEKKEKSLKGALSRYKNTELIEKEGEVWNLLVKEKNENS